MHLYRQKSNFALRALCMLLSVCCACTVFVFSLQAQPAPEAEAKRDTQTVDNEISECEALLSRLKSEQSALVAQMAELKSQSEASREQAVLAAGQVAILQAEIELNESLLESCDMKRSTLQAEQFLVQNEYVYYQEMYAELMRFIYENGTVSDFELLFTSDSLSDYLERRDNFNSIMDCVSDMTQSIEQSLLKLQDLDEEYALAVEKYEWYLHDLYADKRTLESAMAEFEQLSAQLNMDGDQLSSDYTVLSSTISDASAKLTSLKNEREQLRKQEEEERRQQMLGIVSASGFGWPIEPGVSYRISSYYSTRINPITGSGYEFHEGLDIACGGGTKILAAKAGIVTKSAWYGGYGNCVIVYHGKDANGRVVTTLYGHASALKCNEGDQVNKGDLLALVGSTGRSTGNHLHFSVLLDGAYVDPDDYLPDGFYKKLPNS